MTALNFSEESLQAAIRALPDSSLSSVRQAAASQFLADGLPSTKHEDWKYTNLAPAASVGNSWLQVVQRAKTPAGVPAAAAEYLQQLQSEVDACWFIVADGIVLARDCDSNFTAEDYVSIEKLSDTNQAGAILASDPITRLNAALLRDGLRVRFTRGCSDKPFAFLFVDAEESMPHMSQNRIVIEAGEQAQARILMAHWAAPGHERFRNTVVELALHEASGVDVVQISDPATDQVLINTIVATQARDSRFHFSSFDFGGALLRNDVKVSIDGSGANTQLAGLYLAGAGQHIDNHTRVDHRQGPAHSNETYRGILGRGSRCVFNGKAIVHPGADGTDANQSNHNLLLSEEAEIDTKPELEIYADDVKCSHGATVGQLDNAALFYLRSRGLSRSEAVGVLTRSFALGILSDLPLTDVADYLASRIEERLDEIIAQNQTPIT
ncbi:MAG: Fe-S cluster assembly protein SufD [Gammaproteobacteria bacterium]|nr:Fe-S cluster assembly protein SufD [Gammaproteobacteria bacterium]